MHGCSVQTTETDAAEHEQKDQEIFRLDEADEKANPIKLC
jgi:hypothetical protein